MSTGSAHRPLRAARVAIAALVALGVLLPPAVAASTPARTARPGRPAKVARLLDLPAEDPGIAGPDAVDELEYDFGDEAFQPEDFPAKVEVKAKVYAPQTITGRAPLVILLHGRHGTCANDKTVELNWPCTLAVPEIPSYAGYDELGHLLASHGMVVASIGANGINANDGYLEDGGAFGRAQLVLEHLRRWKAWDGSATGSPFGDRFVGHIDLDDIGLMGHSRGGEGVVAAALLNQRIGSPFGIKAVEALAPVDFQGESLGGVPLGVILPYCDGDVSDLQGAHYYDDSRFANPGDPAPKQTVLVYGANHNFFNTVWTSGPGSFDDAGFVFGPDGGAAAGAPTTDACQPGGTGRLAAADQEQAGAALMAGFFRRYLADDTAMQRLVTGTAPFPASTGAVRWTVAFHAPDRLDVERFDTPDTIRLDRFGGLTQLRALSSGLVCQPGMDFFSTESEPVRLRHAEERCQGDGFLGVVNRAGAIDAGWTRPSAMIRLPLDAGGTDVSGFDGLRFRAAVVDDSRNNTRGKQDLSVVLEDADGHRASVPVGGGTNSLFAIPTGFSHHAVLNGVRVPLSSFAGVDLTRVRAVELRFDRTNAGRLALDDVAFTAEGTGSAVGPTQGPPVDPAERPVCRRTAANRWACTVAQVLWGRDPDPVEMARLASGFGTAAGRRAQIAWAVATRTAGRVRELRFAQQYTQDELSGNDTSPYLSATGRTSWDVGVVELAQVLAYGSPKLSSARQIVDALYQSLVGRSADPAGLQYWTGRVDQGGAGDLARSLAATATARGRIVDERYWQLLGRAPDPSGRAYWVGKLAARGGEQALVRALMGTETFRSWASS